jgi:hypothetical protein
MYALMNENGTLARACTEDRCEWGGAVHSSLRLMTKAERRRFRIFDLADASEGCGPIMAGERFEIDAEAGLVRRIAVYRERNEKEAAEAARAEAQRDLAATDLGMGRVLEDVLGVLAARGVLLEGDLPAAARDRLAARRSFRATISAAAPKE